MRNGNAVKQASKWRNGSNNRFPENGTLSVDCSETCMKRFEKKIFIQK